MFHKSQMVKDFVPSKVFSLAPNSCSYTIVPNGLQSLSTVDVWLNDAIRRPKQSWACETPCADIEKECEHAETQRMRSIALPKHRQFISVVMNPLIRSLPTSLWSHMAPWPKKKRKNSRGNCRQGRNRQRLGSCFRRTLAHRFLSNHWPILCWMDPTPSKLQNVGGKQRCRQQKQPSFCIFDCWLTKHNCLLGVEAFSMDTQL